jgi:hypothetical protein
MIKVSIDEGSAFDMLSIIAVKSQKQLKPDKDLENLFNLLYSEIMLQIGPQKIRDVIDSQEYRELIETNAKIFTLVDEAKHDRVAASLVDRVNHQRYLLKKAIQNRFFTEELTEKKFGYE